MGFNMALAQVIDSTSMYIWEALSGLWVSYKASVCTVSSVFPLSLGMCYTFLRFLSPLSLCLFFVFSLNRLPWDCTQDIYLENYSGIKPATWSCNNEMQMWRCPAISRISLMLLFFIWTLSYLSFSVCNLCKFVRSVPSLHSINVNLLPFTE